MSDEMFINGKPQPEPRKIPRQDVLTFLTSLGLDPDRITRVVMDPTRITVYGMCDNTIEILDPQ
jgi:hypothetical protein